MTAPTQDALSVVLSLPLILLICNVDARPMHMGTLHSSFSRLNAPHFTSRSSGDDSQRGGTKAYDIFMEIYASFSPERKRMLPGRQNQTAEDHEKAANCNFAKDSAKRARRQAVTRKDTTSRANVSNPESRAKQSLDAVFKVGTDSVTSTVSDDVVSFKDNSPSGVSNASSEDSSPSGVSDGVSSSGVSDVVSSHDSSPFGVSDVISSKDDSPSGVSDGVSSSGVSDKNNSSSGVPDVVSSEELTTSKTPEDDFNTLMKPRTDDVFDDADIDDFASVGLLSTLDPSLKNATKKILQAITKDGLISRKAYKTFTRVIRVCSVPLIIIGLVTNGVALKVFRRMPSTVTNIYMRCLISFDIAYLVFVVSSYVVMGVFYALKAHVDSGIVLYLYSLHKYLILSARQIIVCATTFMCLDRFLALSCPLKRVRIVVLRRPKPLIAIVSIVIFLYNSHKHLKRQVKTGVFPGTNQSVTYLGYTEIYANNRILIHDLTIASTIVFQYFPLIIMTVANVSLVASLHKYSRRASAAEIAIKSTFRLRHASKESDCSVKSDNSAVKCADAKSIDSKRNENDWGPRMTVNATRSNSLGHEDDNTEKIQSKLNGSVFPSKLFDRDRRSRSNSFEGKTNVNSEFNSRTNSFARKTNGFSVLKRSRSNSFEGKTNALSAFKSRLTKSRSNSPERKQKIANGSASLERKNKTLTAFKARLAKSRSNSVEKRDRLQKERKSNASKSLQFFQIERHKSVTVIVYSVLFLLLALPLALLPLLQRLFPEFDAFKREHYLFLAYTRVVPLFHIISASINFFVFFIKGGAFRTGVCEVCSCRARKHHHRRSRTFRIQLGGGKTALGRQTEKGCGGSIRRGSTDVVLQNNFKLDSGE